MTKNPPITPQVFVAQLAQAIPTYDSVIMSEQQATRLQEEATAVKQELEALQPYLLTDEELVPKVAALKKRAQKSGVWEPHKGQDAAERLAFAVEHQKTFGISDEEAVKTALRELKLDGYQGAISLDHKEKEKGFARAIKDFMKTHKGLAKKALPSTLALQPIDLAGLTARDRQTLTKHFPSGNFLYHGALVDQLLAIFSTGQLVNYKALQEHEQKAAQAEKRDTNFIRRNSGYEGISWSMNNIDALPGDRYHLAGFLASPETVLGSTEQLVVPSRPSPHEVLQISAGIDARSYYDAKTQLELYSSPGLLGEVNSVFGNVAIVSMWQDKDSRAYIQEPLLYSARRTILQTPDYPTRLRKLYSINDAGNIRLDPRLLQQTGDELPVAAVWFQAAIDTGRFRGTPFADKTVPELIAALTPKTAKKILKYAKKDWFPYEQLLDNLEAQAADITIPVEELYFVAPRKDAVRWMQVIDSSPHKPCGILLYDDQKVQLENFASLHRGDHAELTRQLRAAIAPRQGYIEYHRVLGRRFRDDMRAGHKHHVIGEQYLVNRRVITKSGKRLVVKKHA